MANLSKYDLQGAGITNKEIDRLFVEGRDAVAQGVARTANPYDGKIRSVAWLSGFDAEFRRCQDHAETNYQNGYVD